MSKSPRLLPLVGVVAGGALAVTALSAAGVAPQILRTARAMAEEAVPAKGAAKPADKAGQPAAAAPGKAAPVCAPTAAELAKQAGLSPSELNVLQSLGDRRGQLDAREQSLDTQLALMAAAEAKLDAKLKTLGGLKGEIQGLLGQADGQTQAEVDRMVVVFEGMKPKDAAPRLAVLDDAVRLPIAGKMKPRSLSAVLAQMPPAEAKALTEKLSRRFAANSAKLAEARDALAPPPAAGTAPAGAAPAVMAAQAPGLAPAPAGAPPVPADPAAGPPAPAAQPPAAARPNPRPSRQAAARPRPRRVAPKPAETAAASAPAPTPVPAAAKPPPVVAAAAPPPAPAAAESPATAAK